MLYTGLKLAGIPGAVVCFRGDIKTTVDEDRQREQAQKGE